MSKYKDDNKIYRDYFNYVDEAFEVEFSVAPMLFTNRLLNVPKKISKRYAWNWDIAPYDYNDSEKKDIVMFQKHHLNDADDAEYASRLSYITGDVIFNGKTYKYGVERVYSKRNIKVNIHYQVSENKLCAEDEIDIVDWNRDKKHDTTRIDTDEQVLITLSNELTKELEKTFLVTKFYNRMRVTGDRKTPRESFTAKLRYHVDEQQPKLDMEIIKCSSQQGEIEINGYKIDAQLCRIIESKFNEAHIISSPLQVRENEVRWKEPFDWIDIPKKRNNDEYDETTINFLPNKIEQLNATHAVYMWVGHRKGHEDEKYMYIGIVGVRDNSGNTVAKRVLSQERKGKAAENKIIIDKLRLSEIDNCGKNVAVDEVLQTVEMQIINNISAIFGYYPMSFPVEDTIHNLYDKVVDGEERLSSMRLLNDKKRYHNDGKQD